MTPPVFIGSSAVVLNSAAGGVVPWPVGYRIGDVGILVVQTGGGAVAVPTGWAEVAGSPQTTGVDAALTSTRLCVFWRRAESLNEPDAAVPDSGDHQYATMLLIRGALATATPINAGAGDNVAVAATAVTIPGLTTTVDECLVIAMSTRANDLAGAAFSAWTNASLADVLERFDNGTATGTGGGIGIATGIKYVAGVVSATTATLSVAAEQARIAIAIQPPAVISTDMLTIAGQAIPIEQVSEKKERIGTSTRTFNGGLRSTIRVEKSTYSVQTGEMTRAEWATLDANTALGAQVSVNGLVVGAAITAEVEITEGGYLTATQDDGINFMRKGTLIIRTV